MIMFEKRHPQMNWKCLYRLKSNDGFTGKDTKINVESNTVLI